MPIIPFESFTPRIHPGAFVAPTAIIIGDVEIGEDATVWYGAVLRGDIEPIRVGKRTNVQDNSVLHTEKGKPCILHEGVTIGHSCIIHGCEVKNGALIGMGACLLSGSVIGEECIVGAKSLVTEHKIYEARSLVLGVPAKFIRRLTDADLQSVRAATERYVQNGKRHRAALDLWQAQGGNRT